MPRKCTVCNHPEHEAIDQSLVNGDSLRYVAKCHNVTIDSLKRHKDNHIPASLAQSQQAREIAHADSLLDQLKNLHRRTMSILDQAEQAQDLRTALVAVGQARGNLELLGKLAGELQQENTVNVFVMPEWIQVRTVILSALNPYPEAKLSVAAALAKVSNAAG